MVIHGTSTVNSSAVVNGAISLSPQQVPTSRHEALRSLYSPLERAEREWQSNVVTSESFCRYPETIQTGDEALFHRAAQSPDCLVRDKIELHPECRYNFDRWARFGVGGSAHLKYPHG